MFERLDVGVRPRAVILHRQDEGVVLAAGPNRDAPGTARFDPTVTNGVLDERLQDERRHESLGRLLVHVDFDREPFCESSPHDRQVVVEHRQLFTQGDAIGARRPQGSAQEIGQPFEHRVGPFDVAVHHRRDGVQRIEEEVRLEL